jgi:hypothetical protein
VKEKKTIGITIKMENPNNKTNNNIKNPKKSTGKNEQKGNTLFRNNRISVLV